MTLPGFVRVIGVVTAAVLAASQAVAGAGAAAAATIPGACTHYDQLVLLASPLEPVAGVAGAGVVQARYPATLGSTWTYQRLDAAAVGLPTLADAWFGVSAVAADVTGDGCSDAVVGVLDGGGGVGRVVVVPGDGKALIPARAAVLDPTAAGIGAGDRAGWAVSVASTERGSVIVTGAPDHDVSGAPDAGALVTWLLPTGAAPHTVPTAGPAAAWRLGAGGPAGKADAGDHFGAVLSQPRPTATATEAAGPVGGVVIAGIPDDDVSGRKDAGSIAEVHFEGAGIVGVVVMSEGSKMPNGRRMPGKPRAGDHFGASVAALMGQLSAVGIPGRDANGKRDSGAAVVCTWTLRCRMITQDSKRVPDRSEQGDHFGWAVTACDCNLHEATTVTISTPDEDLGGTKDVGQATYVGVEANEPFQYMLLPAPTGLPAGSRFGSSLASAMYHTYIDEDQGGDLIVAAAGPTLGTGTYFNGFAGRGPFTALQTGVYPGP